LFTVSRPAALPTLSPTRRSSDLDQVLAADLAQLLLQFAVVLLGADHHLDARFAVVGGRRETRARAEPLAVDAHAVAQQFVVALRSEEHTSELQSREKLVCRLLLE